MKKVRFLSILSMINSTRWLKSFIKSTTRSMVIIIKKTTTKIKKKRRKVRRKKRKSSNCLTFMHSDWSTMMVTMLLSKLEEDTYGLLINLKKECRPLLHAQRLVSSLQLNFKYLKKLML